MHWKSLTHEKKRVCVEEVCAEDITFVFVVTSKDLLTNTTLLTPPSLYHYSARLLAERAAWIARDSGGTVQLIFSDRSQTRVGEIAKYLELLRNRGEEFMPYVSRVDSKPMKSMKLLQTADIGCGAAYAAFSPNRYGHIENSYLLSLSPNLYRRKGKLLGYGLKFIVGSRDHLDQLYSDYRWLGDL